MAIRLFVEDSLAAGGSISPASDQARYLTQVMRLGPGDELRLFNGRDGEWLARISEVSKRGCLLSLETCIAAQTCGPDLDLIVALVKRARLETIVEKAAELGARRVRLIITERTNADHTNVLRLSAIAAEAAEQTGRLDVPQIIAPGKLGALLDGWEAPRRLMFCDEDAPVTSALAALGTAGPGPWAILIGPEGGFSPAEQTRLRALPFATAVSLGPRILRADTAAISALTLWQAAVGDWREA
ncbi:MAG: 16S rRNA (uracil(1498)-N(3))-methyltransferase [Caulobacteraceae bacterium]